MHKKLYRYQMKKKVLIYPALMAALAGLSVNAASAKSAEPETDYIDLFSTGHPVLQSMLNAEAKAEQEKEQRESEENAALAREKEAEALAAKAEEEKKKKEQEISELQKALHFSEFLLRMRQAPILIGEIKGNEYSDAFPNGPEAESESETEPESEAGSELTSETEAGSEAESEQESETKRSSEVESETEFETEPDSEAESETESEQEPESKTEFEAGQRSELGSETESEAGQRSEPESETESEAEPDSELESETESETEPDSEPALNPELAEALSTDLGGLVAEQKAQKRPIQKTQNPPVKKQTQAGKKRIQTAKRQFPAVRRRILTIKKPFPALKKRIPMIKKPFLTRRMPKLTPPSRKKPRPRWNGILSPLRTSKALPKKNRRSYSRLSKWEAESIQPSRSRRKRTPLFRVRQLLKRTPGLRRPPLKAVRKRAVKTKRKQIRTLSVNPKPHRRKPPRRISGRVTRRSPYRRFRI